MLSKVFRTRGSAFRMLPNPTGDPWLKKPSANSKASWKITRLMEIFQSKLATHIAQAQYPAHHQISKIAANWKIISSLSCLDETDLSIDTREAIHDAVDATTDYILSLPQATTLGIVVSHITHVTEILANPNSTLNTIVLVNKEEALIKEYFDHVRQSVATDGADRSAEEQEKRNTIWITLVFRMLCWLLLHDFDKADVKIVPSDLKGSRMPVYIG
jgi:hypothetical protein